MYEIGMSQLGGHEGYTMSYKSAEPNRGIKHTPIYAYKSLPLFVVERVLYVISRHKTFAVQHLNVCFV